MIPPRMPRQAGRSVYFNTGQISDFLWEFYHGHYIGITKIDQSGTFGSTNQMWYIIAWDISVYWWAMAVTLYITVLWRQGVNWLIEAAHTFHIKNSLPLYKEQITPYWFTSSVIFYSTHTLQKEIFFWNLNFVISLMANLPNFNSVY